MGHPNTSTATKKSCTSGRAGGLNGDQPRADWPAHAGNNNGSRFRFLSLWGGGKNHDLISTGVIPRSLLRRDSRVGWVESFGLLRINSTIHIVSYLSQFSRFAQISPEVEDSRIRILLAPRRQDAK